MPDTEDMSTLEPKTVDTEVNTSEIPINFAPLIDDDTEDFEIPLKPGPATRRRRVWLIPLVIILIILLAGSGVFAYLQFTRPPAVQYTQAAATIGNIAQTVSGAGQVQPSAIYNMNFTASGQIQAIYVHVGEQVKQGQKLAQLSSTSLQDAVSQAQASLNAAEASLSSAETSEGNTDAQQSIALAIAYDNEQNALNTCTTEKNPPANCQQLAEDQYQQARYSAYAAESSAANQVTSAENQVSNAEAALKTAQDNLQAATLTAPHAGIIAAINGMVGEQAGSGGSGSSSSSSSSSAFIVLLDMSSLSITVQVNEADIAGVQVGQPAVFTVAAYPSQTFRASVASIDIQGQTTSSVVTYPVTLAVDNQSLNNAHIYPGMTATVDITTAERIGTLLVPAAALSFSTTAIQNGELTAAQIRALVAGASSSGSASAGGSRGIVVELKNGKLVPVLVTTGLSNGQYTEILSGLNPGDKVVISQTGGTTTTSSGTSGGIRSGGFGGFGGGGFGGGGGRGGAGGGGTGNGG
ncbi:MAG TPA: efflux RND transporter periplasmic adaptor subunit [Ktedonobacteraceae bacterium]|nr:efflux RND transporter periplasmic adaptor subunit [Ktedonobacteraceae bacterium]